MPDLIRRVKLEHAKDYLTDDEKESIIKHLKAAQEIGSKARERKAQDGEVT